MHLDCRQNEAMLVPVRTLLEVKRKFGEERERISYLKVDVEGSEIKAGLLQAVRMDGKFRLY